MLPPDIVASDNVDVLRAALRLVDAQLSAAFRSITALASEVERLSGKPVVQQVLAGLQAVEVPPLLPVAAPTPIELGSAEPVEPGADTPPKSKARKGHGPKGQPGLERVTRLYTLDAPDCACPGCGKVRSPMEGQFETSEMVDVIEMSLQLVTVKRAKYGCTCGQAIETALGPARSIPGGRYSLDFACFVATQKYLYHMPLERQVRWLSDRGLDVSSQVLWDQLLAISRDLEPTVDAIRRSILSQRVVGVDQTGWKDLSRRAAKPKQLWGLSRPDLVYYQICDCKGLASFEAVLEHFEGILVCDEASTHLAAAKRRPGLRLAACWAHVLRRFREARKAFPEAGTPMRLIRRLYDIDEGAPAGEARAVARATQASAVLDELKAWLDARKATPTATSLGSAIRYARNAWEHLTLFVTEPEVPLDNNDTERQLRGPVVGRKNHYGSKSDAGTRVAAAFYTILESAKVAGVSPRGYLRAVIDKAMNHVGPPEDAALLPEQYRASLVS